jgi:hypothetical protein
LFSSWKWKIEKETGWENRYTFRQYTLKKFRLLSCSRNVILEEKTVVIWRIGTSLKPMFFLSSNRTRVTFNEIV